MASNDAGTVGYALDAGARGVIMPMVNCQIDAEKFVNACRYPPVGERSLGPLRAEMVFKERKPEEEYRKTDEPVCMAMVETSRGIETCASIAAVQGLDALFVGPFDLGVAIGAPRPGDVEEPLLSEAITHVRRTAHAAGLKVGIYCPTGNAAAAMAAQGFDFVVPGNDAVQLRDSAVTALAQARLGAGLLPQCNT